MLSILLLAVSCAGLRSPLARATRATATRRYAKSRALPWLDRPPGLDGLRDAEAAYCLTAGDFGFDPFGWAEVGWGLNEGESREERDDRIYAYREAELKHGRLAMLAAVGWPVSELYDGSLSERLGLPSDLVAPDAAGVGLAPSLLNGGLGKVTIVYWAAVLAAGAFLESTAADRLKEAARVGAFRGPGDLGFDPLGLYPSDGDELSLKEASGVFDLSEKLAVALAADAVDAGAVEADDAAPADGRRPYTPVEAARRDMIEQELTHGRTAMLAIVGFAVQEFATKVPVVEETPQFFVPSASQIEGVQEVEEVGRAAVSIVEQLAKSVSP